MGVQPGGGELMCGGCGNLVVGRRDNIQHQPQARARTRPNTSPDAGRACVPGLVHSPAAPSAFTITTPQPHAWSTGVKMVRQGLERAQGVGVGGCGAFFEKDGEGAGRSRLMQGWCVLCVGGRL